jgi:hypothetical protein
MKLKRKPIFLIDSFGAFFSSFILILLFTRFQNIFGIDKSIVYILSPIGLLYSIFSLSSYLFFKNSWRKCLYIILTANIFYCGLIAALIAHSFENLSLFAVCYFLGEVFIILILVFFEKRILSNSPYAGAF